MLARTYPVSGPLDLRRTLGPLSRGPGDPTIHLATGRAWWATRTRDGADVARARPRRSASCGSRPGARAPNGRSTGPAGHARRSRRRAGAHPGRPPARDRSRARRAPGVRIPRSGAVLESLVPAILEQKVTGQAARRAWLGLIRVHGEAAPGPPEWRLRLRTDAGDARRAPLLRLSPVRRRAAPGRPDPAGDRPGSLVRGDRGPAPRRGLCAAAAVPGIGPWTARRSASGRSATRTP